MKKYFLSVTVLLAIAFAGHAQKIKNLNVAKTDAGLVSGTTNHDDHIHIFRGIPFAAPPVGELRWKAPQPVAKWSGIRKCESFSASPMQGTPVPFGVYTEEFLIPKKPISEDCLYLNVWTVAQSSKEKRPVIVWIYGGGFVSGGTACPIYDGVAMAKKGIVFVSINYRVGIFGFFAHPELTIESGQNASGNYGLMDQVAALQWVKKNIAAFGGDPDNVTIAGQSAGSMSVCALMASPLAKGLFKRAIGESGAGFYATTSISNPGLQSAEKEGTKIAQSLNATSINDLRKIPAEELMKKTQGSWGPIVDGYVLPGTIMQIFAAGKQNDVDLLTGWNEDDWLIFGKLKTAEEFRQQAEKQYGANAPEFLKYYPANNDEEAATSQKAYSRDNFFGVNNYTWANKEKQTGKSKVFLYHFSRKMPATGEFVQYGAFHTSEVPYAYDNLQFVNRPFTDVDHSLAKLMSSYWVNFAVTGNPNGKNLPEWPGYNKNQKTVIVFDRHSQVEAVPDKDAIDFLIRMIEQK